MNKLDELKLRGCCKLARVLNKSLTDYCKEVASKALSKVSTEHREVNKSQGSLIHVGDYPEFSKLIGSESAFTKNMNYALDYAFWVASGNCQKNLYYVSGGQPAHIEAWKSKKNNLDSLNFFEGTLKTLEQAWLRPRYDGYMYFQDVGGAIINKYLATGNDQNIVIDQLTEEFTKSFNVNKQ